MRYVIRTETFDAKAATVEFRARKTMYGGRKIAAGDTLYVFVNDVGGGATLAARGRVTSAEATPRRRGVERQTPRVSVTMRRDARAVRPLGRDDVKQFRDWQDGRPQTELNFKFFRQATPKIGGISDACSAFLDGYF
jgi:hypothetical protein